MTQTSVIPWKPGEELATGSGDSLYVKYGVTFENPDKVVRKKGLKVFEEMERKDGHYAAVLATRKLALLGKGYEIQPFSDDAVDVEAAEFVRWNLEHMRGSLSQDLYEILDAFGKGFSLTEIVYDLAEDGPYAGKAILVALKAKEQEDFGFLLDDFDNVLDDGVVQNPVVSHGLRLNNAVSERVINNLQARGGDGNSRRLPHRKFIHYVFNGRAENPYGRGLGGLCYWFSWFKNEGGLKFWLMFLERYGSPTVKVTVTEDAAPEDKKKVKDILKSLQQETGVIVPPGFELDLLEATQRGGEGGYQHLIAVCNAEISKAVLGQTLTTEQGDRGARSLGEVHQEVRFDIMRYDADSLEATLNEQLIRRLVDFNFVVEGYPAFKLPLKPRKDLNAETTSLERLVKMGAQIPERYVHDDLGYPKPEDDEPVLTAQKTPSPFQLPEKLPDEVGEEFSERALTRNQIEPPALSRLKREALDDLIEASAAEGRRASETILFSLIDQVRRGNYIEDKRYDGELSVNVRGLRDALVHTAVMANLNGRQFATDELADKGVTFPDKRFESFAEIHIVGPAEAIDLFRGKIPIRPSEFSRAVAALRRKYFTVAGIEEASIIKLVQEALIDAIENGGTMKTFATAVRERGAKYIGQETGQDLAGEKLKEEHIRTLFRTNVLSAYNEGRRAIFDDPDVEDFVPYLMYSAILDGHARPSHAAMDGRIYRKDDAIWSSWYPPNGFNCRCEVIPVTQIEARRLPPEEVVSGPALIGSKIATPDDGFGGAVAA